MGKKNSFGDILNNISSRRSGSAVSPLNPINLNLGGDDETFSQQVNVNFFEINQFTTLLKPIRAILKSLLILQANLYHYFVAFFYRHVKYFYFAGAFYKSQFLRCHFCRIFNRCIRVIINSLNLFYPLCTVIKILQHAVTINKPFINNRTERDLLKVKV